MYDICIIGAGPAGSTLARLLGERYRVLLVDGRDLAGPLATNGTKVCGGLLAPKAQKELARQGLGVPGSVVLGPQLFAVRAVDVPAGLERLYQRFYINVDREAFDRWLVSLVPPAVEFALGWTAQAIEPGPSGALVTFRTRLGGTARAVARLVVGADGARSMVRRTVAAASAMPARYVAVQASFAGAGRAPYYGALFDRAVTDFYGWTIPKGDTTLAGVALPVGGNVSGRFELFAEQARSHGLLFGRETGRSAAMLLRPTRPTQLHLGSGGIALVGEAGGLISPSSAEGISYALRSARLLARACESDLDGAVDRYRASAVGMIADVSARMAKASLIYGEVTRGVAMGTGLGSIRVREAGPVHGIEVGA